MLSEIAITVSSFMTLHTYFGNQSRSGLGSIVNWVSPIYDPVVSITFSGRCLSDHRDIFCYSLFDPTSSVMVMLRYIPVYSMFFGITLIASLFVGMSEYYLEEDKENEYTSSRRGLKELCGFTNFLLALSSVAGLAASGLGVTLFYTISPISKTSEIGWAELITVFLTTSQILLTISFHHEAKEGLGETQGRIILTDEEAQPVFDEKSQIDVGVLTNFEVDEHCLRNLLYP